MVGALIGFVPGRLEEGFLCIFIVGAPIGLALDWLGVANICLLIVGALTGAALGTPDEADVVHIYGWCAHWVCFCRA